MKVYLLCAFLIASLAIDVDIKWQKTDQWDCKLNVSFTSDDFPVTSNSYGVLACFDQTGSSPALNEKGFFITGQVSDKRHQTFYDMDKIKAGLAEMSSLTEITFSDIVTTGQGWYAYQKDKFFNLTVNFTKYDLVTKYSHMLNPIKITTAKPTLTCYYRRFNYDTAFTPSTQTQSINQFIKVDSTVFDNKDCVDNVSPE